MQGERKRDRVYMSEREREQERDDLILQCVAVCCSVWQCVAVRCSVLQSACVRKR